MSGPIASAAPPPDIKYDVLVEGIRIGSARGVEVTNHGSVHVTMNFTDFDATSDVIIKPPAGNLDFIIEAMRPTLDMFDRIRNELKDRGWQPDVAEDIAASVAKAHLSDQMKKATE